MILPIVVPYAVVAQASNADLFYRAVAAQRYADAVRLGARYLAAHPAADAFAFDLAYAYFHLGRFADARRVVAARDAYLRKHPQNASIWLDLAYKADAAKQYAQAAAEIERYLRFRPGDKAALAQLAVERAALAPAEPTTAPAAPEPAATAEAAEDDDATRFYAAVAAQQLPAALELGERYLAAHPETVGFAIDLAYAYISAGRLDAAADTAERSAAYVREHADANGILAALFYAFNARGATARAASYGERYLALRPDDDGFAMDLTYAELSMGKPADARGIVAARAAYLRAHPSAASVWLDIANKDAEAKQFRAAIAAVDSFLTFHPGDTAAKRQRADYVNSIWGGPRYQTFGYGQYEGRFPDTFFGLDSKYSLAPGKLQPYLTSHIVGDLESGAPGSSQIFSDNAMIFDAGARLRLGPSLSFFGEGGIGVGTRGQGTITDLRYGFTYSQRWGKHAFTQLDASAVLYSRYGTNTISYVTLLHQAGSKRIRPITGVDAGYDAKSTFGNNFLDAFAGVQVGTDSAALRVLLVNGIYLSRGLPIPQTNYSTLRVLFVFGASK